LDCREAEELIPLLAIDALDSEEELLVEVHIAKCMHCSEALHDHLRFAAVLGGELKVGRPPRHLKAQLMQSLEKETLSILSVAKTRRVQSKLLVLAAAAVAFVLLVVIGVSSWLVVRTTRMSEQNQVLAEELARLSQGQEQLVSLVREQPSLSLLLNIPGAQVTQLTGGEGAQSAQGILVIPGDSNIGILIAAGLPHLAEDMVYQVWLQQEDRKEIGGFLAVDRRGWGMVVLRTGRPLHRYQAVGVTMEPMQVTQVSTSPPVLGGQIAR
jgi:hypothetical protein